MPVYDRASGEEYVKHVLENTGAKNKAYDSDVDGVLDLAAIPTITRDKLEYPTENVSFAYLAAINKINFDIAKGGLYDDAIVVVTSDSFTDKAVKFQSADATGVVGRWQDKCNHYFSRVFSPRSTQDFYIQVVENCGGIDIATESVDLDQNIRYLIKLSISGSTLKAYRDDMATAKLTATDTTFASGAYGLFSATGGGYDSSDAILGVLLAPSSSIPPAKVITEVEIIGSGTKGDPLRSNLFQELKEITQLEGLPDYLYQNAKKYEILKAKGFTDEEIKQLFGDIQTHVDLASVTWGAFEHKPEHNTMLICITGGNQYMGDKAIEKQIEHARSKNLKVLKPPKDYNGTVELYRQLKQEFTEWIAGSENFAFQVLGYEDIEPLAVADFYYGELIEHKTHYKQLKQVPEWEMERTLNMWNERIKRVTAVPAERKEKHHEKNG